MEYLPNLLPPKITLPAKVKSAKFTDDATLQEALATKLDRSGPLPWWDSSGKLLPNANTLLHSEIEKLKKISNAREMVLNPSKTKLMIVKFTVDHQYQSLLSIPGSSSPIELAFETKLLGYLLTVNMRPDKHIEYSLRIAYSRLWTIS